MQNSRCFFFFSHHFRYFTPLLCLHYFWILMLFLSLLPVGKLDFFPLASCKIFFFMFDWFFWSLHMIYLNVDFLKYFFSLVFSELLGSVVWCLNLGKFSVIIFSNISFICVIVSLLPLALLLRIWHTVYNCPTVPGCSALFHSFFSLLFQFWAVLLTYPQAHWFFLQLCPVYWWALHRCSLTTLFISGDFFWFVLGLPIFLFLLPICSGMLFKLTVLELLAY